MQRISFGLCCLLLIFTTTIYSQISIIENDNIGIGIETPIYPVHLKSSRNAHSFVFEQLNGTTGERDVVSIIDRDISWSGQDHSSLLKLWKVGTLSSLADGFSLLELQYTNVTNANHDDLYWISAKNVAEKKPTWGVRLHSSYFVTEGGLIVGATGNANGKFSGGNATLMSNGSLGLHTMDPQAELHVNGFVNRLGEQTPSDKRLKSNINSFDKGLEEVLKLNPITFSYSKDFIKSDRQHVGLTAQEVQKIVPEFVGTMELRDTKSTKEEYLNIHDNEIKFLLINAIKDQQKMIESQNLEIQKQQSHIEDLTRKVDALSTIQVDDQQAKEISLIHEDGKAVLLQSRPNPNNGETFIEFNIPNEFQTARILFYSMNGTLIKEEKVINTGVQSLKLDTTRLQSGRYTYSLEIDGTLIDSKSMIVAK